MQRNVTRSNNVREKLEQLLKEVKSITQESIDCNLTSFTKRTGVWLTLEERIEEILNNEG